MVPDARDPSNNPIKEPSAPRYYNCPTQTASSDPTYTIETVNNDDDDHGVAYVQQGLLSSPFPSTHRKVPPPSRTRPTGIPQSLNPLFENVDPSDWASLSDFAALAGSVDAHFNTSRHQSRTVGITSPVAHPVSTPGSADNNASGFSPAQLQQLQALIPPQQSPSPTTVVSNASGFSTVQMQELQSLFSSMATSFISTMQTARQETPSPLASPPMTGNSFVSRYKTDTAPGLPAVTEESDPDDSIDMHTAPPKTRPTPISVGTSAAPTMQHFDTTKNTWRTKMGLDAHIKEGPGLAAPLRSNVSQPNIPPSARPGFFAPSANAQIRQRFADARLPKSDPDEPPDDSWNGGNNFDPDSSPKPRTLAWDTFNRDGHSYQPSREGIISQRPTPPVQHGPTWFQFQVDPYQQIDLDTTTGTIAPWFSPRANYGMILNHPVPLNLPHIVKEFFMAQFISVPFNAKNNKSFHDNFPKFPTTATRGHLLVYHSELVKYCAMHGVFVPPPQTYMPNSLLGSWFDSLDTFTQHHP